MGNLVKYEGLVSLYLIEVMFNCWFINFIEMMIHLAYLEVIKREPPLSSLSHHYHEESISNYNNIFTVELSIGEGPKA